MKIGDLIYVRYVGNIRHWSRELFQAPITWIGSRHLVTDITKYPEGTFKLFVIYDPERRIKDDDRFKRDFEQRSNCMICVIR